MNNKSIRRFEIAVLFVLSLLPFAWLFIGYQVQNIRLLWPFIPIWLSCIALISVLGRKRRKNVRAELELITVSGLMGEAVGATALWYGKFASTQLKTDLLMTCLVGLMALSGLITYFVLAKRWLNSVPSEKKNASSVASEPAS